MPQNLGPVDHTKDIPTKAYVDTAVANAIVEAQNNPTLYDPDLDAYFLLKMSNGQLYLEQIT